MARPGEVTQRAPADAPHGEGAMLQRLQTALPAARPEQQPQPQPPQGQPVSQPNPPPPLQGDTSGGFDQQLYAPTDHPETPVTHGMPFGEGANFTPQAGEDDRSFLLRVASTIDQAPTTQRVRLLAERIRLGE